MSQPSPYSQSPNPPPQGGTIVGLSGFAGVGKDAVANCLIEDHGFIRVGLADGMKRICAEVFDWDEETLWGSSGNRNEMDPRYPRTVGAKAIAATWLAERARDLASKHGVDNAFLSPRFALQHLGTGWGRYCYQGIWIEHALRLAKKLTTGGYSYTRTEGLRSVGPEGYAPARSVVIPDVRFPNELAAIQAVGLCYRVKRPGYEQPAFDHPSETEQTKLSDAQFDGVIDNGGESLEQLRALVGRLYRWGWETKL